MFEHISLSKHPPLFHLAAKGCFVRLRRNLRSRPPFSLLVHFNPSLSPPPHNTRLPFCITEKGLEVWVGAAFFQAWSTTST